MQINTTKEAIVAAFKAYHEDANASPEDFGTDYQAYDSQDYAERAAEYFIALLVKL